jgi:hypothetical protein
MLKIKSDIKTNYSESINLIILFNKTSSLKELSLKIFLSNKRKLFVQYYTFLVTFFVIF